MAQPRRFGVPGRETTYHLGLKKRNQHLPDEDQLHVALISWLKLLPIRAVGCVTRCSSLGPLMQTGQWPP